MLLNTDRALAYLSQNFAVLPLADEPALVVGALWSRTASNSWIADVRGYGEHGLDYALARADLEPAATWPGAFEALRSVLADRGLLGGRIGVELDRMPTTALEVGTGTRALRQQYAAEVAAAAHA